MEEIKAIQILKQDTSLTMMIGEESIFVEDYKISSSADGTTKLEIIFQGSINEFVLSANLSKLKQ